jgi:hypothetical protein
MMPDEREEDYFDPEPIEMPKLQRLLSEDDFFEDEDEGRVIPELKALAEKYPQYWKKGDGPKDPDFGKPNRHTRAKIGLMLDANLRNYSYLHATLLKVAERYPEAVLDALLEASGED